MKIVHIHQYYNDGMGYHENILPKYQAKLGHKVVLITSTLSNGFNKAKRIHNCSEYEDSNFTVKRIPIYFEFKDRFVVFKNLYRKLIEEKPDYIYHHSVTSPSLAVACLYKKNNPNVFLAVDNHADLNICGKNFIWKFFYYNLVFKYFNKLCERYIDIYFGVTPNRCLFLNEELGIDNKKIKLLPIGAEVKPSSKKSREQFLLEHSIEDTDLLIVHGGKISSEKEFDRVVKAFMRIKNQNVKLIIFGSIEDPNIQDLIRVDKRIIFLGWLNREETLQLLKICDIGIWNSQHTTLLEDAIGAELPLILRYYGSTAHLINKNGMFLYQGSNREIEEKLKIIINNPYILKEMKKEATMMRDLLCYDNIAKESISYFEGIRSGSLHEELMSSKYIDLTYENFRKFKK